MRQKSDGFTVMELIFIIAILGVLASLSIAAYQTYTVRSQVSEVLVLASAAKVAIANAYSRNGVLPGGRVEAGMSRDPADSTGAYITTLDIVNGRIDVTFGNQAHPEIAARMLSFTPYLSDDDDIGWRCGNAPPPPGTALTQHRPPTVETRYLPSPCR